MGHFESCNNRTTFSLSHFAIVSWLRDSGEVLGDDEFLPSDRTTQILVILIASERHGVNKRMWLCKLIGRQKNIFSMVQNICIWISYFRAFLAAISYQRVERQQYFLYLEMFTFLSDVLVIGMVENNKVWNETNSAGSLGSSLHHCQF